MNTPEQIAEHAQKVGAFAQKYADTMSELQKTDIFTVYRNNIEKTLKALVTEAKKLGIPFQLDIQTIVDGMVANKGQTIAPAVENTVGKFFPPLSQFGLSMSNADVASTICFGFQELGSPGYQELSYELLHDGNWYGKYSGSYGSVEYLAELPSHDYSSDS